LTSNVTNGHNPHREKKALGSCIGGFFAIKPWVGQQAQRKKKSGMEMPPKSATEKVSHPRGGVGSRKTGKGVEKKKALDE